MLKDLNRFAQTLLSMPIAWLWSWPRYRRFWHWLRPWSWTFCTRTRPW